MANTFTSRRKMSLFHSFNKIIHRKTFSKRVPGDTNNTAVESNRGLDVDKIAVESNISAGRSGQTSVNAAIVNTSGSYGQLSFSDVEQHASLSGLSTLPPNFEQKSFETMTRKANVVKYSDIETDSTNVYISPNHKNEVVHVSSNLSSVECSKHPGHKEFIPICDLAIQHLPPSYQSKEWVQFIQLKAAETVHLQISYTSTHRPDGSGFDSLRGTTAIRHGSGTAFIMNMNETEDCLCSEIAGPHQISGRFTVMTVAHVVFDDQEAQNTVIKFFYDDENETSNVKIAKGERVISVDVVKNRSVIECSTHDLSLYEQLSNAEQQRNCLIQRSLTTQVSNKVMVILISHPHGLCKHVSIGKLLNKEEDKMIKKTRDGVELVGCILMYDTPTCFGTGGGSINVIGGGEVCSAFAPHAAAINNSTGVSGLGWTKHLQTLH